MVNVHVRQARAAVQNGAVSNPERDAILILADGVQALHDDLSDMNTIIQERFDGVGLALNTILERVSSPKEAR